MKQLKSLGKELNFCLVSVTRKQTLNQLIDYIFTLNMFFFFILICINIYQRKKRAYLFQVMEREVDILCIGEQLPI